MPGFGAIGSIGIFSPRRRSDIAPAGIPSGRQTFALKKKHETKDWRKEEKDHEEKFRKLVKDTIFPPKIESVREEIPIGDKIIPIEILSPNRFELELLLFEGRF